MGAWPTDHYGYPLRGHALLDAARSAITPEYIADRALDHLETLEPRFFSAYAAGARTRCALCGDGTDSVSAFGQYLMALCEEHRSSNHAAIAWAITSVCGRPPMPGEADSVGRAFAFLAGGSFEALHRTAVEGIAAAARRRFEEELAGDHAAGRAAELLDRVLGPEVSASIRERGFVDVLAYSGKTYRLKIDGRVYVIEHRRVRARLCVIHTTDDEGSIPTFDKVLGKALHLMAGEEGEREFLAHANPTTLDLPVEAIEKPGY